MNEWEEEALRRAEMDKLRELLAGSGTPRPRGEGLPPVPTPPMFLPPVEVRGGPRLAQTVYALERDVPAIRNTVKRVTTEPDNETLTQYARFPRDKGMFETLRALVSPNVREHEMYDPETGWLRSIQGTAPKSNQANVHMNPMMERELWGKDKGYSPYLMETLAHEIGHQRGLYHPQWIDQMLLRRNSTADVEAAAMGAYPAKKR